METIRQAIKYGVVGVMNTLITAIVIWLLTKKFFVADELANAIGFIAGVVNSFVWNKKWTFNSIRGWWSSAVRFGGVFAICYVLQLSLFIYLKWQFPTVDPYYFQLTGMAFYTVINFVINKFYTFKV